MTRRGRPPTFSREELIAAARRLGPDGISLQNVAGALGVARTSLYWHVKDQNELGELVLAAVVQEGTDKDWMPDGGGWAAWLEHSARNLRQTLVDADGWLRYSSGKLLYAQEALRNADRLLAALLADGFTAEEAAKAYTLVYQMVFASVRSVAETGTRRTRGTAFLGQLRQMAPDDVPSLRRTVDVILNISRDEQFEYNLATTIAGIAARTGRPLA